MPEPKPFYDPKKLHRYPHMFPGDIAIWERFLEKHAEEYTGFSYDIKVGKGAKLPSSTPEEYARMADILSKYRIDVVGFKPGLIEIIEVKPEASTVAIGQVMSYVELYKRDFKPTLPVIGAIVTDRFIPDINYLTKLNNINYYIV